MINKNHSINDRYLTKKSLISDVKLLVYFGTILIGIALAWGSNTQKLEENSKDLQTLLQETKEYREQQIAMQRQVDVHEVKIGRIEDELSIADESARLK